MNYGQKALLIKFRTSYIGNILIKLYYFFQNPIKFVLSIWYINGVKFKFSQLGRNSIKLHVGKHSYGDVNLKIYQKGGSLTIGSYCSISEITILVGGQHNMGISTYIFKKHFLDLDDDNLPPKPIEIGNDVWIGYGATILEGVKIGDGAIIGAGCLVSTNVEPYNIVVGNPPKLLKKRFKEHEIKALQEFKWWDMDEKDLIPIIDLFYSVDIEKFLITIDKIKKNNTNYNRLPTNSK